MTTSNDEAVNTAIQLGLEAKRNGYEESHWKALATLAQKVLQLEAKLHTPVGQQLELAEGMTLVLEKQEEGILKNLEAVVVLKIGVTGKTVRIAPAIRNIAMIFEGPAIRHVDADELRQIVKDYYYDRDEEGG